MSKPKATAGAKGLPSKESSAKAPEKDASAFREIVESLGVAFILALLFRGFVAEPFVIPTGSMAPSLMGAHKDVFCSQCGARYQCGASAENADRQTGIVVGSYCDNCRHENPVPFGASEGDTYSGDRIFVSKFAYVISEPQRWDVIVFKFPYNAKQNYIKRLVGLPGETIHIRHGDLYRSFDDPQALEILRKPDHKLIAMRHLVYDTDLQSEALNAAGYPSRWQPWNRGATEPPAGSWKVEVEGKTWSASVDGSGGPDPQWLRYFHNLPTTEEWDAVSQGTELPAISPYRSVAVTDYYPYNSFLMLGYQGSMGKTQDLLEKELPEGATKAYFQSIGSKPFSLSFEDRRDGLHWVGDLMLDTHLELGEGKGVVTLDLVSAGRHYQCDIDAETGTASLWTVIGSERQALKHDGKPQVAETNLRAGGSYHLEFANFDHELRLWVDGHRVAFSDGTYDPPTVEENRPFYRAEDPLDAAPVGIGIQGLKAKVTRCVVYRDKYYTALLPNRRHDGRISASDSSSDYMGFSSSAPIQTVLHSPESWDMEERVWNSRRLNAIFPLEADQFLPMGDNSPESFDGRSWNDQNYVPRDLLIGKAVFKYWPHPWYGFLPHFSRMGLIH